MAIQYRLYQEKREVKYKGKWNARAVSVGKIPHARKNLNKFNFYSLNRDFLLGLH